MRSVSRKRQLGTTLLEPIIASVALGAAAATALPSLVELGSMAAVTTLQGVAAAAASAMHANRGACLVAGPAASAGRCVTVQRCEDVALLFHGGMPDGYSVAAQELGGGGRNGAEAACTITQASSGQSARFQGISAGL
jgi:hypothetical protein